MVKAHVKLKKLWFDVTHLASRNKILVVIILVVLLGAGFLAGTRSGKTPLAEIQEKPKQIAQVTIASIRELSQETGPLQIIGEVAATSEASVRTEAQGVVTQVNVDNGDFVSRGSILTRIESSSQIASLRQAEAALASAQASIERTQSISGTSLSSARQTLSETEASAINTMQSLYAQAEEIILTQADILFSNPLSSDPRLVFAIPTNQQEKNRLEDSRIEISKTLQSWEITVEDIAAGNLTDSVFDAVEGYADEVNTFLARLSAAASSLQATQQVSASDIAAWKGAASGARSAALGIPGGIDSLRTALSRARTNVTIAEQESAQASLGGSSTAEASLRQAESAVAAAEVALAKTVVRAPISGVVNGLSVKRGDVVSPLQSVLTISNASDLEIITYVTEVDKDTLSVGGSVLVGSRRLPAKITRVASTVDPATRKIEVIVVPDAGEASFVDGQSVSLAIERSSIEPETMLVPLASLKVLPTGFALLTVGLDNKVEAILVDVGPIVGDRVLIRSGSSLDDLIITDVRGISPGEEVELIDPLTGAVTE